MMSDDTLTYNNSGYNQIIFLRLYGLLLTNLNLHSVLSGTLQVN